MACIIAVVRERLQRSSVGIFHVLRVATARSPRQLPGAVRLLIVHAVDRDQRAVQDDVGQQPDPGHRLAQVVGGHLPWSIACLTGSLA